MHLNISLATLQARINPLMKPPLSGAVVFSFGKAICGESVWTGLGQT